MAIQSTRQIKLEGRIKAINMNVQTMAEMLSQGKIPEVLFWVGAAGSYDDRAKKITRAFVKLLHKANVDFAVL